MKFAFLEHKVDGYGYATVEQYHHAISYDPTDSPMHAVSDSKNKKTTAKKVTNTIINILVIGLPPYKRLTINLKPEA